MNERAPPPPGGHPDPVRLDAVRAGEGSADEQAHVRSCPGCREIVEGFAAAARALREGEPPVPEVPAEVDGAVLAAFRRSFPGRAVGQWAPAWGGWLAPAATLAATALFAAVVLRPLVGPPPAGRPAETEAVDGTVPAERAERRVAVLAESGPAAPARDAVAGDVNGDGRLDILDAYRLAVALERLEAVPAAWDADGDGAVDQRDVAALARRAVALRR